ncbi:MAG: YfiR/HmsC family protein [Pseudomonadota bacterium]|jgi:hypothetical protein
MNLRTGPLLKAIRILALILAAGIPALPASAEVTEKDFQVIARALGFMTNGPKGAVDIAIVHSPDNPASMAEAKAAQSALGEGLKAGDLTLRPIMAPADDLGKLTGVSAIFVAPGTDAQQDAILEAAKSAGKIIITTDRKCVEAGKCVMFVATAPSVEILVNKAAASVMNISFDAAFKMMIKEI